MAISLFGSTGSLFNALGQQGVLVAQCTSYQSSQKTNFTGAGGAIAQLVSESDIQAILGSAYIGQLNAPGGSIGSLAQQASQAYLNRLVYRDNPQAGQTLTTANTLLSIAEVIRQMKQQGATVLAMTIGATPTQFNAISTNTGNGVVNTSTKRPFDGLVLENSYAETVKLVCTQDSYTGNATAGNETLSVNGTGAASSLFAFNWPGGSGQGTSLNAIDGNASNASGNGLQNSGFNTWTVSNTPDNWVIEVGTAGTQIFEETTIVYDGAAALRLLGDGSTLTAWSQTFGVSTGTTSTLSPLTQYSFCVFVRRDGVAAANGNLVVELTSSTGTQILDANGVANAFNIDLTGLTTTYTAYTGVFRTPEILPTTSKIRFRLSTALTNGRSVYIDKASLGLMTQLGTGSPFFAVHAGNTNFVAGDYATVAVTNSRGSGGTLATWQTALARLLDPYVLPNEILFPSSAVPNVSDSLL